MTKAVWVDAGKQLLHFPTAEAHAWLFRKFSNLSLADDAISATIMAWQATVNESI
jgi:hypothetical protein